MRIAPRLSLTGTVAVAATALCALAPAALASTTSIQNANRVNVAGSGNERNQITVAYDPGLDLFIVTDATGTTTAGVVCTQVNTTTVTCPGAGIATVRVQSTGGNDTISLSAPNWPATIEGDLDGGSGNDRVTGAGAADTVRGDSGTDILDGGTGADELRGGSSTDVAYYGDRTTRVTVTVGAGNDNDGNELDQTGNSLDSVLGDVETVIGGTGPDILVGDSTGETLFGGDGDDVLFGKRGSDTLLGANGGDFLSGEDGNDSLFGAFGPDRLFGGSDEDRVVGGAEGDFVHGGGGVDRLKGKGGIDVLIARDGFTDRKINCGPGPNGREFARRDVRLDPRPKSC
jgi:Ca2+-binding RTX toxin-like protein